LRPSSRTSSIRVRRVSLSESSSTVGLQLRSFWDKQSVSGLCPDSLSLWPTRSAFEPSWPWLLPPPAPLPLFTTRRRCTSPSPRFIVRQVPRWATTWKYVRVLRGIHHRDHFDVDARSNGRVSDGVVIRGSRHEHPSRDKHCAVDVYPKVTSHSRWPGPSR